MRNIKCMKKVKWLAIVLTIGILTLLAVYMLGDTRYVNGKGNDYLVLSKKMIALHKEPPHIIGEEALPELSADSISEMISKIKTGSFTDLEHRTLVRRMNPDEQRRVVIPDLQNLVEIIPPKGMTLYGVTIEMGGAYCYYYKEDDLGFDTCISTPADDYIYQKYGIGEYKSNWSNWPSFPASSTTEDIRAAVTLDDDMERKYQVHTDTMVFYVVDHYSSVYSLSPCDRYVFAELWNGQDLQITTRTLVTDLAWLSEIAVQRYRR